MKNIFYKGQIIWSMIDMNGHMRHSVYADFAAQARVNFLFESKTYDKLKELNLGPILFREELIYLKELKLGEVVNVSAEVLKNKKDLSRFSIKSIVYRSDGTKSAEINADCAWFNLNTRKIASLPEDVRVIFLSMPRTEDYFEFE